MYCKNAHPGGGTLWSKVMGCVTERYIFGACLGTFSGPIEKTRTVFHDNPTPPSSWGKKPDSPRRGSYLRPPFTPIINSDQFKRAISLKIL